MHFRHVIVGLLFFLATTGVIAQSQTDYSSILKGVWVTTESLLTSDIESPFTSSYFKYYFNGEGTLFYATNELERGQSMPYRVTGNKVEMMGYTYTIVAYEDEQL